MFRDLKEYQEIAKIYAEKVSKPEDLDERVRGGGVSGLMKTKPATPPQKGAGGGVGNPTNVRGSGARNNRPKPEKTKIPSTDEIRKNNPNVVPGTRVNEIGQKSDKPSEGDFKKDFPDKKPDPKPMSTRDKFKSKFIKKDKGVGFVKRGTPGAQRAENKEKNKLRAQEMAKARIEAKKKAEMSENVDLTPYDYVLEYLLSSEQAATIEEANYVMTEMDAETIQGIVEEQKKKLDEVAIVPAVAGIVAAGTLGAMGINAIRKMNKNKEKMDKGETFKKGSTMDNIQKKNQMYKDMGIAK